MNRLAFAPSISATSNVIPLHPRERNPASTNESPDLSQLMNEILRTQDDFLSQLKAALESSAMTTLTQAKVAEAIADQGPFGPIYIAELMPDPIVDGDKRPLDEFAHIKDLSSSISFDDGWDD